MRNRYTKSFALCALLLMLYAFAGFCVTLNKVAVKPVNALKIIDVEDHHAPYLNDDLPQISHSDTRHVLKLHNALHRATDVLPLQGVNALPVIDLSLGKYPPAFKTLFPEHEFS